MKNDFFIHLWALICNTCCFAQKSLLTFEACKAWPDLAIEDLSDNGRYANDENCLDFTEKLCGSFDRYLKDKPMPDWMKEHV